MRRIFLISILLTAFAACLGQRQVTGRVLDYETRKPIKDVVVSVEGKKIEALTNYLGFFQMDIDSGDVLSIGAANYDKGTFVLPDENTFQVYLTRKDDHFFEGGVQEFSKSIGNRIKYPAKARKSKTRGIVYVYFEIDSTRQLRNIAIVKDLGKGLGEEVVSTLKSTPKNWIWNKEANKFILQITFELGDLKDTQFKKMNSSEMPKGRLLPELVVTACYCNGL